MEYNDYKKSYDNYDNTDYKQSFEEKVEYYEVLTDGQVYWVSVEGFTKICSGFSAEQLANFNFSKNNLFGKEYVSVTEKFLIFIKNNTYNPKYLSRLALLENNYDHDAINELMKHLQTDSEATEIEYEQVEKSR